MQKRETQTEEKEKLKRLFGKSFIKIWKNVCEIPQSPVIIGINIEDLAEKRMKGYRCIRKVSVLEKYCKFVEDCK